MTQTLDPTNPLDRARYIGGSDIAAILGISPWRTPYQVFHSKVAPDTEKPPTAAQERGRRLERFVLAEFGDDENVGRPSGLCGETEVVHPAHSFMVGHLDDHCLDLVDDETRVIPVEAKTAHPYFIDDWGASGTDHVPHYYLCQLMHYLLCAAAPYGFLAVWIGWDDYRWYRIEFNEKLAKIIEDAAVEMWRCVQEGEAPDPMSVVDCQLRWADHTAGEYMVANEDVMDALHERARLKALKKAADDRLEELDFFLMHSIADHEAFLDPENNQKLLTYRTQAAYTVDAYEVAARRKFGPPTKRLREVVDSKGLETQARFEVSRFQRLGKAVS